MNGPSPIICTEASKIAESRILEEMSIDSTASEGTMARVISMYPDLVSLALPKSRAKTTAAIILLGVPLKMYAKITATSSILRSYTVVVRVQSVCLALYVLFSHHLYLLPACLDIFGYFLLRGITYTGHRGGLPFPAHSTSLHAFFLHWIRAFEGGSL